MNGETSLGKAGGGDVSILICYLSKFRFFLSTGKEIQGKWMEWNIFGLYIGKGQFRLCAAGHGLGWKPRI